MYPDQEDLPVAGRAYARPAIVYVSLEREREREREPESERESEREKQRGIRGEREKNE